MSRIKSILLLASILTWTVTQACDMHGKTGFMPENKWRIPVGNKSSSSVTKEDAQQVIDVIRELYQEQANELGFVLYMLNSWEEERVNASAQITKGKLPNGEIIDVMLVNMSGGLARYETMTRDGFALATCHEVGHHLGGAPRYKGRWSTTEGQADYWATSKCLRKFYEKVPQKLDMLRMDQVVKKICEENHKNSKDQEFCMRTALAGQAVAKMFNNNRREMIAEYINQMKKQNPEKKYPSASQIVPAVKFDTPDKNIVKEIYESHPEPQCRLDTYLGGALCTKDAYDDVDLTDKDLNKGLCTRKESYEIGIRPLCWFKPVEEKKKEDFNLRNLFKLPVFAQK